MRGLSIPQLPAFEHWLSISADMLSVPGMDQALPSGWTQENKALTRTFERADFVEALGFLLSVARLAEAANHHPDIDIRYNKVRLSLTTHDAGHQVTAKDFDLAEKINGLTEDQIRFITQELHAQLGV